ncbi:MAG: M23 family metallopeptidase [Muribaculaceae bacterium]|nr:M23 family metallopeptidase [Muribaculaceae bacterium]
MKSQKKYRLIIEDETCLEKIGQWTFRPGILWTIGVLVLVNSIILGFLFVLLTPAKRLIPGYYKPSQRVASEEAIMRLDSLYGVFNRNNRYVSNILTLLNEDRDAEKLDSGEQLFSSTSPVMLMATSKDEVKFNNIMHEREKYNISVLAPLAANGMKFYPVSREAIIATDVMGAECITIQMPSESMVMSVADGTVLDVHRLNPEGQYIMVMQHNNGFTSKYSGLGSVSVGVGEIVNGGQVVGMTRIEGGGFTPTIQIEMWHNGTPLKPYKYITGNITL